MQCGVSCSVLSRPRRLNNNAAAINDCNSALAIDEENVKALARRAGCYMALGGVENIEVSPPCLPCLCL